MFLNNSLYDEYKAYIGSDEINPEGFIKFVETHNKQVEETKRYHGFLSSCGSRHADKIRHKKKISKNSRKKNRR
jgi:hypothetical protein